MAPTVDILLPTRNPEPGLLRRAIRSVLDQTCDDWLLYVVQDGGFLIKAKPPP